MKKKVRQTQKITNMAGERILHRVERDLGLTLVVLILGLIYSDDGTRGLPVPWLGSDGANAELFLVSLLITFCAVFCIDLLAAAISLVREPSADRQTAETSVIVNAVEYAEYEDEDDYGDAYRYAGGDNGYNSDDYSYGGEDYKYGSNQGSASDSGNLTDYDMPGVAGHKKSGAFASAISGTSNLLKKALENTDMSETGTSGNTANSVDAMFSKLEKAIHTLSSRLEDFEGDDEESVASGHYSSGSAGGTAINSSKKSGDRNVGEGRYTYADRAARGAAASQKVGQNRRVTGSDDNSFARTLSGDDSNNGSTDKKRSSAAGIAITLISLLMVLIAALPAFNDAPDDIFDDWDTENVATDDESDSINYDSMFYLAYDALYNLGEDEFAYIQDYVLSDMTQAEFDAMKASDIEWGNTWFEEELGRSYNEERTRVTIVYRINDDSQTYIAAFNFTGSNLDDSDPNEKVECTLVGFTVFPDTISYRYGEQAYPESSDEDVTDSGELTDNDGDSDNPEDGTDEYESGESKFDISKLSAQEIQKLISEMQADALSAGKNSPTAEDALLVMQ